MTELTPDETLLGLIAIRPRHGYELLDCFRDRSQLGEVWKLSTSQLYAVLKRLQRQELIYGRAIAVPDAPVRTEFSLTETGYTFLYAWLSNPTPLPGIRNVRVEFLSRLYIARMLNLPTLPIVERQKAVCRQKYTELQAALSTAVPGITWLTLNLMCEQYAVILQWLDRCELNPRSGDESSDESSESRFNER